MKPLISVFYCISCRKHKKAFVEEFLQVRGWSAPQYKCIDCGTLLDAEVVTKKELEKIKFVY